VLPECCGSVEDFAWAGEADPVSPMLTQLMLKPRLSVFEQTFFAVFEGANVRS